MNSLISISVAFVVAAVLALATLPADAQTPPAGAAGTGAKSKLSISSLEVVQQVTVKIPAGGVVVVNASGNVRFGSANGGATCSLTKDPSSPGPLVAAWGTNTPTYASTETIAITRAFNSKKGGKRTYYVVCSPGIGADIDILGMLMTAVYAPENMKVK